MKCLALMLMMLMLLAAAKAEGATPLDVRRLHEEAYPGYSVLSCDGYDDGKTGQWALVLHQDGDNVLVFAERTDGGDYALTINNPNAVPDEKDGYSSEVHEISVKLSKHYKTNDRLGLFELTFEQPGVSRWLISSELMEDGKTWGNVISDYTFYDWDKQTVWWSNIMEEDGTLSYMRFEEDEAGKARASASYPRMPVAGEAAQMHLLEHFDAAAYPYMPDLMNGEHIGDYAQEFVPEGDALLQLDLQEKALILLVESAKGERTLRVLPHENWQFREAIVTKPLPGNASLDLFHAEDGTLQIEWYGDERSIQFGFAQKALDEWVPSWLQIDCADGGENYRFTQNSIAGDDVMYSPMRNDGVIYGDHPWRRMEEIDFAGLPVTKEAMLAMVDRSRYAVVNNPNPEDRLHLREQPRKDARSKGRFYNRTPVLVLSVEGEWAKVSMGGITGYMMTKYLAFGEEMDAVACAFPQEFICEDIDSLPLRPWKEGKTAGHITRETAFYIVGVDEERYVILTEDGTAGYVPQSSFYPGNG